MIKFIEVYIEPMIDKSKRKYYFFWWFRSDYYMNQWLKKHNIDWYLKHEFTIISYIRIKLNLYRKSSFKLTNYKSIN